MITMHFELNSAVNIYVPIVRIIFMDTHIQCSLFFFLVGEEGGGRRLHINAITKTFCLIVCQLI